ncbi:MAG: MFS transporter, partial [Bacteroidetes bacterium]|nr:MFS transporter [Bacteroidota bacterium]
AYESGFNSLSSFNTAVSSFLYFEQAHIVDQTISDSSSRTRLFGGIDFVVNTLALSSQLFLTGRLIRKFGMAIILAAIPLLVMIGFFSLSLAIALPTIIIIQIIHRAGNFSLLRPGREMLFTVTPREDRYKSKNFIDTAIYRGSDALTGWAFAGLVSLGFSLSTIAVVAIPLAGAWALTGFIMGKRYNRISK